MKTVIKNWGNSKAIRIPKAILEQASLKENEIVEINVIDNKIILTKINKHKSLKDRIKEFDGDLTYDFEEIIVEPIGDEIW